jgi:hypothetical protein
MDQQADASVSQTRTPTVPSRRLRFSLRGFILAIGVICLVVSNAVSIRELRLLRDENQQLRDELGYLTIEDPTRVHVIAVSEIEDWKWRWRLHVPERSYPVVFLSLSERGRDEPTYKHAFAVGQGERTLDIAVVRSPQGNWHVKASNGVTEAIWELSEEAAERFRLAHYGQEPNQFSRGKTVAVEPNGSIVLLESDAPELLMYGESPVGARTGLRAWMEDLDEKSYSQLELVY